MTTLYFDHRSSIAADQLMYRIINVQLDNFLANYYNVIKETLQIITVIINAYFIKHQIGCKLL